MIIVVMNIKQLSDRRSVLGLYLIWICFCCVFQRVDAVWSADDTVATQSEDTKHHMHPSEFQVAGTERMPGDGKVGIESKTGQRIPLDLIFTNENGDQVKLGDVIRKPTLILPVYYYCPGACSLMLANLAQALNQVPLTPGKEYQVAAVSFDPEESPSLALNSKQNYLKLVTIPLGESDWLFLTGEALNVDTLMTAMGYGFKKTAKHTFIHPNVLIALSADGTIVRYLYGPDFLPFDIGMALTEAARGETGVSIRKLASYCFSYDPESRTYVFNIFRIFALGVLTVLVFFFVLFLRKGRRRNA